MKFNYSLFALAAVAMFSCGPKQETETPVADANTANGLPAGDYMIVSGSALNWAGSKAAYGHNGTIAVKEGKFTIANGTIGAGTFTIDMASIADLDVEAPADRAKLEGHLKSADFFDAEKFPTATFTIKGATAKTDAAGTTHEIKGELTLKGVTKEVVFNANITAEGDAVVTTAKFDIDRSLWEVKFNSTAFPEFANLAADMIISNKITVGLVLKGTKVTTETAAVK